MPMLYSTTHSLVISREVSAIRKSAPPRGNSRATNDAGSPPFSAALDKIGVIP